MDNIKQNSFQSCSIDSPSKEFSQAFFNGWGFPRFVLEIITKYSLCVLFILNAQSALETPILRHYKTKSFKRMTWNMQSRDHDEFSAPKSHRWKTKGFFDNRFSWEDKESMWFVVWAGVKVWDLAALNPLCSSSIFLQVNGFHITAWNVSFTSSYHDMSA